MLDGGRLAVACLATVSRTFRGGMIGREWGQFVGSILASVSAYSLVLLITIHKLRSFSYQALLVRSKLKHTLIANVRNLDNAVVVKIRSGS